MKGHSSGAPATSRHHKHHQQQHHHNSSSRVDKYRPARTISRDSSTSQDSNKDHHQQQHHSDHHRHSRSHSHPRTGTGRGSETIGFIPGSADGGGGPAGRHTCGACSSLGWSSCKALICCLLTCGFYGSREPCLPATAAGAESSTDHPPKPGAESRPPRGVGGGAADSQPSRHSKLPTSDSFRYPDVRIAGQTVVYPVTSSRGSRTPGRGGGGDSRRPVSGASLLSMDDDQEEEPEQLSDVDSLISKKLLELYALHQIDQLARCTSDSSFSRKTNEISELIYSVAQDLNLQEREAECRLVHGVIRISTRKNQKNRSQAGGRRPTTNTNTNTNTNTGGRCDGTLPPDSGNETMTFISSDFPEVKVSEQTPSDELARKMRHHSGRTFSSSTTTAYSAYHHETETDSSGAPLLL